MNLENFVRTSITGNLGLDQQKQFLLDLNEQGYSGNDIATLVKLFYQHMPESLSLPGAIDLCGTGGSGLSRINTSTLSAIVLAACGVPVAKHGNKAASGRFGSFDLLESMGINIMADRPRLESLYKELGLAFIFARRFHPVFKHFAQVRQELKVKTVFNILGPLLNPANPQYQIIGTSNLKDMRLIAEAAKALGKKRVLVLNGGDGLDELTLTGETAVVELNGGEFISYTLQPEDFGFHEVDFSEIQGGDQAFNVKISQEILGGTCTTAHLNLVLANTALALKFMGEVDTYEAGVALAQKAIQDGSTLKLIEAYSQLSNMPDILKEITDHKRQALSRLKERLPLSKLKKKLEPSDRDFRSAISQSKSLTLIAEIKKNSPSEKEIYTGDFHAGKIAATYEASGADAISVLTDQKYFGGALENLSLARSATKHTPLLFKDFIIDEYQIYLARYYGADAVLLISAILSQDQIEAYFDIAKSLNMDVLLEVHNEHEIEMALKSSAEIIGINNRNLHTFEVDTRTFIQLFHQIPKSRTVVAESGYDLENIHGIQGLAQAALVGTTIMKSKDIRQTIRLIKTEKKKFKACGIRTVAAALHCEEKGVDLVGLNFVPTSKRCIDVEEGKKMSLVLKRSRRVGIFQDQPLEEVEQIAVAVNLDFVQLSGSESVAYCAAIHYPVIKTIKMSDLDQLEKYGDVVEMFIIDGARPGSGQTYDYSRLQSLDISTPYLIAGGVSVDNAAAILADLPRASGLDAATGIETDGIVDISRIDKIADQVAGP